jgi:hypothetical protein
MFDAPLSDEEYGALALTLDEHAALDIDGVIGMMHALAVAPSVVPIWEWIDVVMPRGIGALGEVDAARSLDLLVRLYDEVVRSVSGGEAALLPHANDAAGCNAFAAGFVAGAELDKAWIGHEARRTFAGWAALLAGRLDLVPWPLRIAFAASPEGARRSARRRMAAAIAITYRRFRSTGLHH